MKKSHCRERTGANSKISLWVCALAILLALAAMLPGCDRKKSIHIATKPMTEQYIIGEMLKLLIEQDTGTAVRITQGVGGGTSNIHPAMVKGEFDLYPEYTGTGWNAVLKKGGIYQEDMFEALQEGYTSSFSLEWVGMYGFNNTFGLAVRKEVAEKYGLKTYSDVSAVAGQLIFGAEYDFFERGDGFTALSKTYGLAFKKTIDLDIGLKYQAIGQKQIDVMNIFTTDGQLSASGLVVLADDKRLYPSYRCGNVVSRKALRENPALGETLLKMTDILSDSEMARLNYLVEMEKREPKAVAEAFLRQKKLLR